MEDENEHEFTENERNLMSESLAMTFTMHEWAFITALLVSYAESSSDVQPMLLISAINQNVLDAAIRGEIGKHLD